MSRSDATEFVRNLLLYVGLLLAAGAVATVLGQVLQLVGDGISDNMRSGLAVMLFVSWLAAERVRVEKRVREDVGAGF